MKIPTDLLRSLIVACRFPRLQSRRGTAPMRRRSPRHQTDGSRFTALPPAAAAADAKAARLAHTHYTDLLFAGSHRRSKLSAPSSSSSGGRDFTSLPYDVLSKIAASFDLPELQAASLVCRAWRDALRPLREGMLCFRWGKRFKHGRSGVRPNRAKAFDLFLEGAARGFTPAMVDAGLMFWETGKRDKAIELYQRAAALGDPSGQCNLAISYLQAEPPQPKEAVHWLHLASVAGHARAQYQLALCLQQGSGTDHNLQEAARWYLKAAKGGYGRAMYNVSLCYSFGEGFAKNHHQARKWMKRAADRGHSKAQLEHGLNLFSEGKKVKAAVYLELATRAGESRGVHVKDLILEELSLELHQWVTSRANDWRARS